GAGPAAEAADFSGTAGDHAPVSECAKCTGGAASGCHVRYQRSRGGCIAERTAADPPGKWRRNCQDLAKAGVAVRTAPAGTLSDSEKSPLAIIGRRRGCSFRGFCGDVLRAAPAAELYGGTSAIGSGSGRRPGGAGLSRATPRLGAKWTAYGQFGFGTRG